MTNLAPEKEISTLADLIEKLGDIPASRILLHPAPGTATENDALRLSQQPRKRLCELLDGVLVEKDMAFRESGLAAWLITFLFPFVRTHNLGIITGEQGMLRLFAGRVRIPDVCFISWDQIPDRCWPTEPIANLHPDLAIEILSESNTPAEMRLKRQDYFNAGTQVVWEIDPNTRTVQVYSDVDQYQQFASSDTLSGGSVLPGFQLSLTDLFTELDRQGS